MTHVITIVSGKGGVGKTTSAVNLGAAMKQFGKEVIVLDANLTTPNLGLHLGAPIVPTSLNQVLAGKASVHEAVYEHESGMKIVPSSLSVRELKKLNEGKLKNVARQLRKMADIVLYDSAAGLGGEALAAIEASDEVVLVTNPEIPAVTDALKASKVIEDMGKPIKGVVVTRVRGNKTEMPVKNIQDMLELPLLGVIPEDVRVQAALVEKDAVMHTHPNAKVSRAYRKLAAKMIGKEDYKEEVGLLSRLFGW